MRILFSITVNMVHTMHNSICTWNQVRRTLRKPCHQIKDSFPTFTRRVHLVGSKPMQKKRVKE